MVLGESQISFKTSIKKLYRECRGTLALRMKNEKYSIKEIAETLGATEGQIYDDLRKIANKKYLRGEK